MPTTKLTFAQFALSLTMVSSSMASVQFALETLSITVENVDVQQAKSTKTTAASVSVKMTNFLTKMETATLAAAIKSFQMVNVSVLPATN